MHMRIKDANFEEVLLSGKGIYLYSKPGWNCPELCSYVEHFAEGAGIRVQRDTVYSFKRIEEDIIRYLNIDGWKRTVDLICGFEKYDQGQLYCDDESLSLAGGFLIRERVSAHGNHSGILNGEYSRSPAFILEGINNGDVISSSIKSDIANDDTIDNIRIWVEYADQDGNTIVSGSDPSPGIIADDWFMSNLFAEIVSQPMDSSIRCYVEYNGDRSAFIDDFTLKVYSQKP